MRSTLTIGQACANWLAGRYGLRKSAKAAYRNGLQPLRDRTALDLDAGTLKVAATISRIGGRLVISKPKTERSRREVPLHPSIVTMLRKHRVAQKAEKLHVYCGINYRVTDLPFIQTWWVRHIQKLFVIGGWCGSPIFLMLTCVLLERAECNGIQSFDMLLCQVCVSYE